MFFFEVIILKNNILYGTKIRDGWLKDCYENILSVINLKIPLLSANLDTHKVFIYLQNMFSIFST